MFSGGARPVWCSATNYAFTESLKSISNCLQTTPWSPRIAGGGLHLTGTATQNNKGRHLVQVSRQPRGPGDSFRLLVNLSLGANPRFGYLSIRFCRRIGRSWSNIFHFICYLTEKCHDRKMGTSQPHPYSRVHFSVRTAVSDAARTPGEPCYKVGEKVVGWGVSAVMTFQLSPVSRNARKSCAR